jgi:hypothetical protein
MTFSNLFGSLLFGSIGFVGWSMGRTRRQIRPMICGALLMSYTFVVPEGAWTWSVGSVLTLACFWP